MNSDKHNFRDVSVTEQMQLNAARHNCIRSLDTVALSTMKGKLILTYAHELPPALSDFAGLGAHPFKLYNVIEFHKLQVMDLGLIRQFCDLTSTVIRNHNFLPLTKLMTVLNDRYSSLPPSARLPSHRPFRTSADDTQAGISGKIHRQTAPVLWCCIMWVTDHLPDSNPLLRCALKLYAVNKLLFNTASLDEDTISHWKGVLFEFGRSLAQTFNVDVSTKMHRLVSHIHHKQTFLGCIYRSSSEENETLHKTFKAGYTSKNRQINSIGPQLLQSTVDIHDDDEQIVDLPRNRGLMPLCSL